LAADSGASENEFVARVSTESTATPGQSMELAFDTSKITIFDADTGANLTIAPSGSNDQTPEPPAATAAPPPPPPSEQAPSEQAPSEQAPLPPAE
jgi:multiple sugar transport system ATP-binding protein